MSQIEYNNFEEKNKIDDILNLIYDYTNEKDKSKESKLYKKILSEKISRLNNNDKNKIQDYIYQKSKETNSRDNKLQLLELYAQINNSKNNIETYNNLNFDVIWGSINWKYKIISSNIEPLWNNQYLIHIKAKKRQNNFITYVRKATIPIEYNNKNWVIRYNNWYWEIRILAIDHKYETKFNINEHKSLLNKNINWTIYQKWVEIPVHLIYKWQKIDLIIKF